MKNLFAQKKEEVDLEVAPLSKNGHEATRELWESIFVEDSKEFVDFYYTTKAKDNTILAVKQQEEIVSMLQLNPYQIRLGKAVVPAHYIVGVATKKEHRRKGLMRRMIEKALWSMYEDQEAFTYLMPAKTEYYEPFDFKVVYHQKSGILNQSKTQNNCKNTTLTCKEANAEDYQEVVQFAEEMFQEQFQVFTARDSGYFQTLQKQFRSDHGDLMLLWDEEQLIGYFFYGEYDQIDVMEPICKKGFEDAFVHAIGSYFYEKNKSVKMVAFSKSLEKYMSQIVKAPSIMFRIVNLEKLSRYLRAKEEIAIVIGISDPILERNNGSFLFQIGPSGCLLSRTEQKPELFCSIGELTEFIFSTNHIKKFERVPKLKLMKRYESVFINELV